MRVDFAASERHFVDHLMPVYMALEPQERGSFWTHRLTRPYMATKYGVESNGHMRGTAIATAAVGDLNRIRRFGKPIAFFEHGAGFYFGGRHPSYAGGRRREGVALFPCQNEYTYRLNREHWPDIPAVIIGCPKLDRWHNQPAKPRSDPPVVCISFHWNCVAFPETRSALDHYRAHLPSLLGNGWEVIGHGHPRAVHELEPLYNQLGIEFVPDFDDVLARADVYVNDSSSTLYEFASLDRPVVVLNAPWYRRGINHGLRWWEHSDVGVVCNEPEDLLDAVVTALEDHPEQRELRHAATAAAYPVRGDAAGRAVQALRDIRPVQKIEGHRTLSTWSSSMATRR